MPDPANPTYVRRLRKWFTDIGSGEPGQLVSAIYRGRDADGNPDPLATTGGGIKNKTYNVILLTGEKLFAPCPDFCNGGEAPNMRKIDEAIENTLRSCDRLGNP